VTVAAGETIGVAIDTAEALTCPEGYELQEAEFADGGLFDNLPVGLARLLAESSRPHTKAPLPVEYFYIGPDRQRYRIPVAPDLPACEGEYPPAACRELTHDIASETAVLGGAIGTARKYELYRELTSDNWRLNLSQLSQEVADLLDASQSGGTPGQPDGRPQNCHDRLSEKCYQLLGVGSNPNAILAADLELRSLQPGHLHGFGIYWRSSQFQFGPAARKLRHDRPGLDPSPTDGVFFGVGHHAGGLP
jgi:hypothetical protein